MFYLQSMYAQIFESSNIHSHIYAFFFFFWPDHLLYQTEVNTKRQRFISWVCVTPLTSISPFILMLSSILLEE